MPLPSSAMQAAEQPLRSSDEYPTVIWPGFARSATFAAHPAQTSQRDARSVVVFAWCGDGFVLADVEGRGWCTPSGRIEAGETAGQAAVRETWEETGGRLREERQIGSYELVDETDKMQHVPVYVGLVSEIGPIPPGSESLGVRCVSPPDLPACYYWWDDLMARVFALAESVARVMEQESPGLSG